MPRRLALLFIVSLFVVSCSSSSDDEGGEDLSTNACSTLGLTTRIINGTACREAGSPIVELRLFLANGSEALCTGTMLTSDDVLTAAHCFFDNVTAVSVEAAGQRASGASVIAHPNVAIDQTTGSVLNDAAIIRLNQQLNLPTLPLLGSRSVTRGDVVSIFGYGLDENGNLAVLRSGEMEVREVTPNHIFADYDGDGSNTCNGDSGGPAIFTFTGNGGNEIDAVVGIVSTGIDVSCGVGDTTLFTNAQDSSVFDFIVRNVPDARIQ